MTEPTAKLIGAGGDRQYHYAYFVLEFGRTVARISLEVDGPDLPAARDSSAYVALLRQVGAAAALKASVATDGAMARHCDEVVRTLVCEAAWVRRPRSALQLASGSAGA